MPIALALRLRSRLPEFLAKLPQEYARSTVGVLRSKGNTIKKGIRRDIARAGLGERLGQAVRSEVFPHKGVSMNARGRVFSKAIVARAGRRFDLITIFEQGAVIQPRSSRFLAIPTAEAGTQNKPHLWPRGSLFARTARRGAAFLAHVDRPDVPLFILVRQVRIRPRIKPLSIFQRQIRNLDTLLARDMERRAARLAKRLAPR